MSGKTAATAAAVALCAVIGIWAARCDTVQPVPDTTVSETVPGIAKHQDAADGKDGFETQSVESEEETYWLKAVDGRLGVFVEGREDPEMVLDVYLGSLPQSDRTALQQGIPAGSYRKLVSMLEDYIS